MKRIIVSFIAIYSALVLAACGKSGGGGGNNNTGTIPNCAVGTVWNGSQGVVIKGGG